MKRRREHHINDFEYLWDHIFGFLTLKWSVFRTIGFIQKAWNLNRFCHLFANEAIVPFEVFLKMDGLWVEKQLRLCFCSLCSPYSLEDDILAKLKVVTDLEVYYGCNLDLKTLPKLKCLYLCECKNINLPESLIYLSLDGTDVESDIASGYFPDLRTLHLNELLPSEFEPSEAMPNLTELGLNVSEFDDFKVFQNCFNLRILNLEFYDTVPFDLSLCQQIVELDCSIQTFSDINISSMLN